VKYWEIIADKKGKYVSEADAIKEGDRAAAKGQ